MKVLVLLNSAAGSVDRTTQTGRSAMVQDAFAKRGVDVTIRIIAGSEVSKAAREFLNFRPAETNGRFDALVVAGGDGTISAAAGELAGSDLPLGILPLGTLNHFAKDLGLPLDLDGAARVVAAREVRRVDVAELNGRVFVNNSSIGLYPFMVAQRNAEQRRFGLSKLAATLPAALRTLWGAPWYNLGIAAAGDRESVRTPCFFVGNNSYDVDLPSFGTRTRLDRGELCVHVVRQQSRLGVLLLLLRIAWNRADRAREVETFRVANLEITSRAEQLEVSLDGEIAAMKTPLRYRTRPGALCVLAQTRPDLAK